MGWQRDVGETGQGQTSHCVLGIPSLTEVGSSSSPQLGDENPDLASTMMSPPTLGAPILKLEGEASHSCAQLGLSLVTHGHRGHSREGLELKVFVGENRSVHMAEAIPHIRESKHLSGGALGHLGQWFLIFWGSKIL